MRTPPASYLPKAIAIATVTVAACLACNAVRAATLAADYQLQDVYTSSVGTIGPLTVVGDPGGVGFITDTVDAQSQRVLNFQTNATGGIPPFSESGVQTQTNPSLSSTTYSIVLLAKFDFATTDPIATKVFDFKNLSSDDGLYVNPDGMMAFNGVTPLPVGGTPIVPGTYVQIVLTRDATGLVSVYQDGALAFQFNDSAGQAILADATMSGNSFLTLFQDDGTGLGGGVAQENSVGNIARLRLYDGALTPEEVGGLDRTIPEPASLTLVVLSLVALASCRLRRA